MSACTRCGAAFTCGMVEGGTPCWCAALPPLAPGDYTHRPADVADAGCYCPACLQALLKAGGDQHRG